jgi:hypothetical protein
VSAPVRRHDMVYLVTGNPHPFAVHFDFVVITDHTALGRATVQQVAARTSAVIPSELGVELLMPSLVADPQTPFLRRRVRTEKRTERAAKGRPSERLSVRSTD